MSYSYVEYHCEWWRDGALVWRGKRCESRQEAEKMLATDSTLAFDEGRIVEVTTSMTPVTYVFKSKTDMRGVNGDDDYLI